MYQWCRISFINSRLNMIKTHPHLYLGPFQHFGGSNTKDVNRTMDIRWVLAAVTDGARDLCKSSRYCEILTKMRETSLIIIHKSCLILYFPWNIWVLVWLSADLRCLGIIPTRSVGSFLWEAWSFSTMAKPPWTKLNRAAVAPPLQPKIFMKAAPPEIQEPIRSEGSKRAYFRALVRWWYNFGLRFVLGEDCFFFSERFQVGDSLKMYMNPSSQEVESSKGCWAVLHQVQVFLQICYSDLQLTIPFFWWLPNICMI